MTTHALDKTRVTVITTRPSGQGASLCRALRRHGLRAGNVPAVRVAAMADRAAARAALEAALGADRVIFTSPNAVRHAVALQPTGRSRAARVAVGRATARALQRAGWGPASVPARADSEGLLALDELTRVAGQRVAIVGAAGGRKLLGETLIRRGARLQRANVYRRLPARLDARHWRLLDAPDRQLLMTVTSAQAIRALAQRIPPPLWQQARAGVAIASSARLVRVAQDLGFARVLRAPSAGSRDLTRAIGALF